MARTVDPILATALEKGEGVPYVKAITRLDGVVYSVNDVLEYTLEGTKLLS